MNRNAKYDWTYAIPASDRFFNVIAQDEDTPVDGNEDDRLLRTVSCTASSGINADLAACREPMSDGAPQRNPERIRYTRILPLRLSVVAEESGQVELALATPLPLDGAERMHLWVMSSPELADAGCSLWAVTTGGGILLDGDCAGHRWRFCEASLAPRPEAMLTGLRLVVGRKCRGILGFDALRAGRPRGFSPHVEAKTDAGRIDLDPPRIERGGSTPVRIVYTTDMPLAPGTELSLVSPVQWFFQAQAPVEKMFVTVAVQNPVADPESMAVACRRCAHTRWRTEARIRLDRSLASGCRIVWTIHGLDWANPDNQKCSDRSFSLFLHRPGEDAPRRHVTRPAVRFFDRQAPDPAAFSVRGPAFRRTELDGLIPFFGYLHAHSDISEDGRQSPESCYAYGRDVAKLDFCALSDHFWAHEPSWKWDCIQQVASDFYRPGAFVTFPAYEWSSQDHGDRNVYFPNEGPPCCVGPIESTPVELYEQLEGVRALVVPHSPAFEVRARGVNWDFFHPGLERIVEIFSAHGSSEGQGGNRDPLRCRAMLPVDETNSVRAALERGYQLGFIAGGDDHCRPCPVSGRTGLAGVWADQLTRDAVFDALYQRRCFGTTAPAMAVAFKVNGCWMGQRLNLPAVRCERACSFRCVGDAPIRQVEWIRNGRCARIWRPEGPAALDFFAEWCDTSLLHPLDHSYVRVLRFDGHTAWSSPVFIQTPGDPS